jgi:ABC-type multidrug transport system fused ATPase/permease subunit
MIVSVIYAAGTGLLVYVSNRYKAFYVRKRLLQMRKTLANGTLQTDIADYEQAGSASYVTAFNQNFSIIEEKVLQNQISILDSVISIVLAVLVLLWMNPLIAIISTVAMAIPSLLPRLFTKALGKAQKNVMESTTAYNEKVSDLLNGHEVIKTYHAEGEMLPQFSASARHLEISREQLYQ